ncbi:MAG: hypothetical protein JNG88_13520 [Phycisphaerales bacterium]|nr:hypothetical protein [Phycisphaerales bacterium]
MNITPNTTVVMTVTATPTREAGLKTIIRLARKDPSQQRIQRHRKAKRPSWQEWRRGGRFWHHQMRTEHGIRVARGASFKFRATTDVLRDLESIAQWVSVSPAK